MRTTAIAAASPVLQDAVVCAKVAITSACWDSPTRGLPQGAGDEQSSFPTETC